MAFLNYLFTKHRLLQCLVLGWCSFSWTECFRNCPAIYIFSRGNRKQELSRFSSEENIHLNILNIIKHQIFFVSHQRLSAIYFSSNGTVELLWRQIEICISWTFTNISCWNMTYTFSSSFQTGGQEVFAWRKAHSHGCL